MSALRFLKSIGAITLPDNVINYKLEFFLEDVFNEIKPVNDHVGRVDVDPRWETEPDESEKKTIGGRIQTVYSRANSSSSRAVITARLRFKGLQSVSNAEEIR